MRLSFRLIRTTILAVLLNSLLAPSAWTSDWQVQLDDKSGLPVVSRGGSPVLQSTFAFWLNNWGWAHTTSSLQINGDYNYSLTAQNQSLDFNLSALIKRPDKQQLTWEFRIDAGSQIDNIIGGGMVFKFDLANLAADMGAPKLLSDNRGWSWGNESRRLELKFDAPLARLYFERGNPAEVRAFFFKDSLSPGQQTIRASLTLSGDFAIATTAEERFGPADISAWPSDSLDWKTSPVDLSFLNSADKPAGKRGFVRAVGEQLQFSDGTTARFWGTNISAYTLFGTPHDVVKLQARRLAELGFNLVRLHHHDSPWVNPNIFGDSKQVTSTQQISAESLERLDWWIKCLKDEGIYIWLDLHVQRALREQDNIFAFDEIRKGKATADLKGYAYVNITIQSAMKRFAEDYVSHVNSYTGVAYKDEPAIAAMLLTNENDITHHFGNALLPDKQVPQHSALYMAEAEGFAKQHDLPASQTWRAWEHGPAKLFLNDLEHRFNLEMIQHLRALGVRVPIATTNTWGGNGLSSLPALTAGDLIDAHSYGGLGQLDRNPQSSAGIMHWIAAAQVVGKPVSVTEWNTEPFPTPDRHALPLYLAGSGAYQGWDALMQYAYSQERINGSWITASNWHAYTDPALLATLPAAALLYRRGDIREASTTFIFAPSASTLFNQRINPDNSIALRSAAEKGKLQIAMPETPELPWLQPSPIEQNTQVIRDPGQSVLSSSNESSSDTGELRRNWQRGIFTIDSPRSQLATGWLGGKSIELGELSIASKTRNASVALQSLDRQPIAQSKSLLISIGTRAIPKDGNKVPFYVEPFEGQLSFTAPAGLKVYRRGILAQLEELPSTYANGRYTIKLNGTLATNWLFIR